MASRWQKERRRACVGREEIRAGNGGETSAILRPVCRRNAGHHRRIERKDRKGRPDLHSTCVSRGTARIRGSVERDRPQWDGVGQAVEWESCVLTVNAWRLAYGSAGGAKPVLYPRTLASTELRQSNTGISSDCPGSVGPTVHCKSQHCCMEISSREGRSCAKLNPW